MKSLLSDESESLSEEFDLHTEYNIQPENEILLRAPKDLVQHPEIASVADRLQLSDNSVTMFLSAVIKACNGTVSDFSLSRSTTRRKRIASRHKISLDILEKVIKALLHFKMVDLIPYIAAGQNVLNDNLNDKNELALN